MLRISVILSFLLLTQLSKGQIDPQLIATMPSLINESSGLQYSSQSGLLWTHNDGGDGERVYAFDLNGQFQGQVIIDEPQQTDYEDIAKDQSDNFYIGDFGNNANDRQDLEILKTASLDLHISSVINSETISFNLSDQTDFPPVDSELNFDIEAMIHINSTLHLFTRNRTTPYDGLTKWYSLSDQAGDHTAVLQGSFQGVGSSQFSAVTAADVSPSGERIAFLSNGGITLLTQWSGTDLSSATATNNFFTFIADLEGITFINECEVIISEEAQGNQEARLWSLNTCNMVMSMEEEEDALRESILIENGFISIETDINITHLELVDLTGRTLMATNRPYLDASTFSGSVVILLIEVDNRLKYSDLIHLN